MHKYSCRVLSDVLVIGANEHAKKKKLKIQDSEVHLPDHEDQKLSCVYIAFLLCLLGFSLLSRRRKEEKKKKKLFQASEKVKLTLFTDGSCNDAPLLLL